MHPRVVHCQRGQYDVYVGRGRCPRTGQESIFGNPFSHLKDSLASVRVKTRVEAIQAYEAWLRGTAYLTVEPARRLEILKVLSELRLVRLGCWCAPKPCHGETLLRLAEEIFFNGKLLSA